MRYFPCQTNQAKHHHEKCIYTLISEAREKINWEMILAIANVMNLKYHGAENITTKDELENLLSSLLFTAETQWYVHEKEGDTKKPISVSSGCWHVTITTFSLDPIVKVSFGPWVTAE